MQWLSCKLQLVFVLGLMVTFTNLLVADEETDLQSLSLEELMNVTVYTTNQSEDELRDVAAATYVLDNDFLSTMNVRTLDQALRFIPGMHVQQQQYGDASISVRGFQQRYNENILLLIDGNAVLDVRGSSAFFQFLDKFDLAGVQQIEVVVGPTSSLYGANAMGTVVNVVYEKDAGEIVEFQGHTEYQKRVASTTLAAHGGFEAFDGVLSYQVFGRTGDGPELFVEADAFGRSGEAAAWEDAFGLYMRFDSPDVRVSTRMYNRSAGDYYGLGPVLNDSSEQHVEYYAIRGEYEVPISGIDLEVAAYANHQVTDNLYYVYPAGTIPDNTPLSPYNEYGYVANPLAKELSVGTEITAEERIGTSTIKGKLGILWQSLFDVELFSTFDPLPLPGLTDVSSYYPWIEEQDRLSVYGLIQTRLELTEKLTSVFDLRVDVTSDFGTELSPRLGLVYHLNKYWSLKLATGRSFRSPDFSEMYVINTPLATANPDLKPEHQRTFDVGALYSTSVFETEVRAFVNEISDLVIRDSTLTFVQSEEPTTYVGLEVRSQAIFADEYRVLVSGAWNTKARKGDLLAEAPQFSGSLSLYCPIIDHLSGTVVVLGNSEIGRLPFDSRLPVEGSYEVGFGLQWKVQHNWSVTLSVDDAFNTRSVYPSDFETVPGDLVAPGRTFRLSASIAFVNYKPARCALGELDW